MAKLTKPEIEKIIASKGCFPFDISTYENKDSNIQVQCAKGHIFTTTIRKMEKESFVCPVCVNENFLSNAQHNTIPPKKKYRIVAFDQSSHKIGVSIYDDGKLTFYNLYELTGDLKVRLTKWNTFLNEVIKNWKPDFLAFEDIQYQKEEGVITFKVLAFILGISIMAATANKIPCDFILNKVWQKDFDIRGANRAIQKKNSIQKVKDFFDLDVNDDVADSILIGLYYARRLSSNWEVKDF